LPDYTEYVGATKNVNVFKGTYPHPNDTSENDAMVILASKNNIEVSFDMINLAQTTTVRVYEKVDDATYRPASEKVYPTDFPANVDDMVINLNGKDVDMKITFQSGTAEGSVKNVPHARVEELRE